MKWHRKERIGRDLRRSIKPRFEDGGVHIRRALPRRSGDFRTAQLK